MKACHELNNITLKNSVTGFQQAIRRRLGAAKEMVIATARMLCWSRWSA